MLQASHHIAQFNVARIRAPLEDPSMAGFVQGLDHINHLSDRSEGFIWRLQTAEGSSVSIRPYEDQRILITLSVWDSIEHLFDFAYTREHAEFLKQRHLWFEHLEPHYLV